MRLYDTHAHFPQDADDTRGILDRAAAAGVAQLMAVGGDEKMNRSAALAHAARPDSVRLALGADYENCELPPGDVMDDVRRRIAAAPGCAAIGEIGLDFHYSPENAKAQQELFARQLALADELALPVVIHTREADDATLGVLDEVPWRHSALRGVIHCYTGDPPFAGRLLDRGFMVSFSGIVTFRMADNVRASAKYVPEDRLLIETDSPFLAPVPMRGKANEPAFVVHTAKFMSALRGVPEDAFAERTFANAVSLFG